jgi:hypothetical protein
MIEREKQMLPDWGAKNILGLEDSKEFTCEVRGYRNSHSLMRIQIHYPDYYTLFGQLIFLSPSYFQGTFSWNGAEINVGEKEELKALLERIGQDTKDFDQRFQNSRLYQIPIVTASLKPYMIQIVAWKFVLSNEVIKVGMIYDC